MRILFNYKIPHAVQTKGICRQLPPESIYYFLPTSMLQGAFGFFDTKISKVSFALLRATGRLRALLIGTLPFFRLRQPSPLWTLAATPHLPLLPTLLVRTLSPERRLSRTMPTFWAHVTLPDGPGAVVPAQRRSKELCKFFTHPIAKVWIHASGSESTLMKRGRHITWGQGCNNEYHKTCRFE